LRHFAPVKVGQLALVGAESAQSSVATAVSPAPDGHSGARAKAAFFILCARFTDFDCALYNKEKEARGA